MILEFTILEHITLARHMRPGWYMVWIGTHEGVKVSGLELISDDDGIINAQRKQKE